MSAKSQISDQSIKGAVIGLAIYGLTKVDADPAVIAMATPVIAGLLAWASTKVGDKDVAAFLSVASKQVEKVVEEAQAKKAPAKKAAAKKPATKKAPSTDK